MLARYINASHDALPICLLFVEPARHILVNGVEHYLLVFQLSQDLYDDEEPTNKRIKATWQYWGDEVDYLNTAIKIPKFEHVETIYLPSGGSTLNYETDVRLLNDMANLEWSYEAFSSNFN
jgi:hypothetical protein